MNDVALFPRLFISNMKSRHLYFFSTQPISVHTESQEKEEEYFVCQTDSQEKEEA